VYVPDAGEFRDDVDPDYAAGPYYTNPLFCPNSVLLILCRERERERDASAGI